MLWILERISYSRVALAQGVYYFLTGIWPLIDISSFVRVTGPKTDVWLVHTVGLFIAVIGLVLIVAGIRWKISPEIFILAVGSAFALTALEIIYVFKWNNCSRLPGRCLPANCVDCYVGIPARSWRREIDMRSDA